MTLKYQRCRLQKNASFNATCEQTLKIIKQKLFLTLLENYLHLGASKAIINEADSQHSGTYLLHIKLFLS